MRGRIILWLLPSVLVAAVGIGAAMAATGAMHSQSGTVRTATSKTFGTILVGPNGRTLYRYTDDSKGVNRCSSDAACNKYWPPLVIGAAAKPSAGSGVKAALLGTIKAANGKRQVTYAGFPLYYFVGDKAAGQVKGQAFDSTWYVLNVKGALVKHAVTSTPATTSTSGDTTTSSGGGGGWG
jgi:predicted lipoprotein with Yx(FWY)xxD motif